MRLKLEHGVASHDTFGRVFAALDTASFFACVQDWIEQLQLDLRGRGVHVDGKTARRSHDAATNRNALHLVSAWVDDYGVCLGQVAVDEESNEIAAVPLLLELLSLKGAVVTLDAMHCQRKTVAKIVDREADYVVTVKANQNKLHEAVSGEFLKYGEDNYRSRRCRTHRAVRKNRGRYEERIVTVAPAPRAIKEQGRWAGIQSIGMVYRRRGETLESCRSQPLEETERCTFFISSLPPKAKHLASYVNKHWTVENSLHWTLDVTFGEDASRARKGNSQEIMAGFRRLALSILKQDTSIPKESIRGKRHRAGWSDDALEGILAG